MRLGRVRGLPSHILPLSSYLPLLPSLLTPVLGHRLPLPSLLLPLLGHFLPLSSLLPHLISHLPLRFRVVGCGWGGLGVAQEGLAGD